MSRIVTIDLDDWGSLQRVVEALLDVGEFDTYAGAIETALATLLPPESTPEPHGDPWAIVKDADGVKWRGVPAPVRWGELLWLSESGRNCRWAAMTQPVTVLFSTEDQ